MLDLIGLIPPWVDAAACARPGVDPETFFPHSGDHQTRDKAKQICGTCDVEEECPPGYLPAMHIVHRAHITYRQLDYWTRTGLLHDADRRPHATSGTFRYYPVDQLHRAATLSWLLDAGISLQMCRLIIDDLLDTGSARLTNGLTIHLPEDI